MIAPTIMGTTNKTASGTPRKVNTSGDAIEETLGERKLK